MKEEEQRNKPFLRQVQEIYSDIDDKNYGLAILRTKRLLGRLEIIQKEEQEFHEHGEDNPPHPSRDMEKKWFRR